MSTPTRILAATITAAFALPVAAQAQVSPVLSHRYERDYHAVASKLGARAPGRNIVHDGLAGGQALTSATVARSIVVLQRMLAPQPKPAPASHVSLKLASSSTPATQPVSSGGGYSDVPGVPPGFAACVAMRESSNGAGSSNIYGIIPASGHDVAGMSVAQQKAVMAQIYRQSGASAWAPYDGC